MRKGKWILTGCCAAVLFIGTGKAVLKGMVDRMEQIPVSVPNLAEIADGVYAGEYSAGPVAVKVEVTVEGHRLTAIEIIEHQNGLGGKAEGIIEDVMDKQSLEVDAVSGATVSSKCILKALEDALGSESELESELE